jgi:two-component system, OmpR family, phosphate regulon sensor histidine kinase PhoR
MADKLHLTNILHNLVDNAVKYCNGTPHVTIRTANGTNGKLVFTIKDTGVGIPKEHLGRIFEKFFRVPTGDVHDVKGFGLGLFYTKNICDAHGWKIFIDSEVNKGTTVTILM